MKCGKIILIIFLFWIGCNVALEAQSVESNVSEQELDEIDSLMVNGHWEKAEKMIVDYLRARPGDASNALVFSNLGVCHTNMGRYEDAIEDFDIALVKYPESTKILANKARTLLILGRNEEALETLDKALEVNEYDRELTRMRGLLLYNDGKYREALHDFEKLKALSGGSYVSELPEFLAVVARAQIASGKPEEAEEIYKMVIDRTEDPDLAFEALCYSLTLLPDEVTKESVNKLIKKFPEEGRLYLVAAVLCERGYLHTEADMNKKIAKQYGIDSQTIEFFITQNLRRE